MVVCVNRDDDDINDVAAMGGVNLVEESRNILAANAELVSGQLRSCKDEIFLDSQRLHARIADISEYGFVFQPASFTRLCYTDVSAEI